ncbi:hypothetical protein BC831DRAFT_451581 [Entophlyctis helioformis]|nr:hypothetical protein BC831DRAFT_451581 [Entophlyctis helioformis]
MSTTKTTTRVSTTTVTTAATTASVGAGQASSDFTVAVLGGGLVGSLAAVYFAKRGFRVNVYEKRKDIRTERTASGRSINLALSVRGLAGLAGAGVDTAILPALIPMKARMIHSLAGALSSQPYGIFGECINSVDRKLINERLLTAAETYPNLRVFFEHGLESCDLDNKTFVLSDAKGAKFTATADLIIGADGAFSRARAELLRKIRADFSQHYIDHAYVELTMPPTASGEYAMDPEHLHIWPRQTFMMIALPNLDKSFTVTLFMPWSKFESIKTQSDLVAFFETTFPDSLPLISRELLIQEYFKNQKGALVSIKCKPYHYKDRIVIVGDAAHAMVPFYGQGMNCGFEDVLVLDEIFTKHLGTAGSASAAKRPTPDQIEAVLAEYSKTRNPDAEAICDLALHNYVEMRSSVTRWDYLVRKRIEGFVHRILPSVVIPLYTMVSFSRIPYSEAMRRYRLQTLWYERAMTAVLGGFVFGAGAFTLMRVTPGGIRRAFDAVLDKLQW